jgi:hypothetical protein
MDEITLNDLTLSKKERSLLADLVRYGCLSSAEIHSGSRHIMPSGEYAITPLAAKGLVAYNNTDKAWMPTELGAAALEVFARYLFRLARILRDESDDMLTAKQQRDRRSLLGT